MVVKAARGMTARAILVPLEAKKAFACWSRLIGFKKLSRSAYREKVDAELVKTIALMRLRRVRKNGRDVR